MSPLKKSGLLELQSSEVGIRLTHQDPTDCGWLGPSLKTGDPVMGNGIDGHSLLRQTKEELASTLGSSAIEPESEFIQIVVEVLMTDRSLVGSHQPTFE